MRRIKDLLTLPRRICLYSQPKAGKTRTATSLPDNEIWGRQGEGKTIVYVAADPSSESLSSVLPHYRDRLEVVKPRPAEAFRETRKGRVPVKYDPLKEAVAIATYPWADEGFKTLIWDTMTVTARDLLKAYALMQNYTGETKGGDSKAISFGQSNTPEFHIHPTMGDYGAAQSTTDHILQLLFEQPLNLIVLFHEEWVSPKQTDTGETVGGPATVGSARVKHLPGLFDHCIRQEAMRKQLPGRERQEKFVIHTGKHGPWIAGLRCPGVAPGDINLEMDPGHWWVTFEEALRGEYRGSKHEAPSGTPGRSRKNAKPGGPGSGHPQREQQAAD